MDEELRAELGIVAEVDGAEGTPTAEGVGGGEDGEG